MSSTKVITMMALTMAIMFVSFYFIFERTYHIKVEGVENFVAPEPETAAPDSSVYSDYEACVTEMNYDIYQLREKYFKTDDVLRIRTRVHYFANSDTSKLINEDFLNRIDLANQFFVESNAGIELVVDSIFVHLGKPVDVPELHTAIDNFENFVDKDRPDLRNYYYGVHNDFHHTRFGRDNAMNIYIYNDSTRFSGKAGAIESNYFALSLKYLHPDLRSLEHELGHCFGLYHTHQLDASGKSHSQEDGDYICATHVTFPLSKVVDRNCRLFRNWEDVELPKPSNPISSWDGIAPEAIETLIKNLMSYVPHECRQEILSEQVDRMRKIFEMNSDMRKMVIGLDANFKQNIIKSLSEIPT